MRGIVALGLVACGAPTTTVAPPQLAHQSANVPPTLAPIVPEPTRIFRQLTVGALPNHSNRVTFTLTFDGDRATLVESTEHAPHAETIADADRDAVWSDAHVVTYTGTHTREPGPSGAQLLQLTADGPGPLPLRCVQQPVVVAAAHARRVPTPNRGADYECGDRGVWDPPSTTVISALVCTAAGQAGGDDPDGDDDDRLVFAPAPGIEWVFENDDCVLQGGGLRLVK